MNGSTNIWKCLYEEISWVMPGGRHRKGKFIKALMRDMTHGYLGDYTYETIREQNLYEQVGQKELPKWYDFVFNHILIPFGPVTIYLICCYFL